MKSVNIWNLHHHKNNAINRHHIPTIYPQRKFATITATNKPLRLAELLKREPTNKEVKVSGWVRGLRQQKESTFVDLNDGSLLSHLQIVLSKDQMNQEQVSVI
jgi:hypothetical protein